MKTKFGKFVVGLICLLVANLVIAIQLRKIHNAFFVDPWWLANPGILDLAMVISNTVTVLFVYGCYIVYKKETK